MNTTKTQSKANPITIAPVPCRMIRVKVYETNNELGEKDWGIAYSHVIGFACTRDKGLPDYINAWPVVVGTGTSCCDSELLVEDDSDRSSNLKYKTIVPCFWSPEEDREHSVRIGKELIAKDGNIHNWASIPQ